jgi:hypothetical protein
VRNSVGESLQTVVMACVNPNQIVEWRGAGAIKFLVIRYLVRNFDVQTQMRHRIRHGTDIAKTLNLFLR